MPPSTANFSFAPLSRADRRDLFAHLADPQTVAHMDIHPLANLADADEVIAHARRLRAAEQGVRWAIRDAQGRFVGTAGFNSLVRERAARGEVAYDVVRPLWGRGVMTEVLPVVLEYGFENLGLRRIEAMVTPGNTPSANLLERHGFQREAVLRDYAFWKGCFRDQWLFSLLAAERTRSTAPGPAG